MLYSKFMPSRNRLKFYASDAFYHVYNRGVEKRRIFQDEEDYAVYLNLFKRYLSNHPVFDRSGREYEHLKDRIELLCFCLMPNHYHLIIYVHDETAMTRLLQGVNTSYTAYFNKKYKRVGPLFQDRYKASNIFSDSYLLHISRYIHLNPENWQKWPYSSLSFYLGNKKAEWLSPERILELFEGDDYQAFVSDYEANKRALEEIKSELANY